MKQSFTEAHQCTQPEIDSESANKIDKPGNVNISYEKFVFLLNRAIAEIEGRISELNNLVIQISECRDADFIITYLSDEHNNLGFSYLEKKELGFKTNGRKQNDNIGIIDKDVKEEDMSPISRGLFISRWLGIVKSYKNEFNYLTDLLSEAEVLSSNNFSIQCYINTVDDELEFILTEKKPMGFPGAV